MSLKFKYFIFVGLLHLLLIVLVYTVLKEHILWFLVSEIGIILSLFFSYYLYASFIRPIQLLQSGSDAIQDGDFSIKYTKTGTKEVDNLIVVYNDMIEQLRNERTMMSEQSHFIQKLINVTPLGIIIMDYDGLISNANPAAKNMLGINTEILGKHLKQINSSLSQHIDRLTIGETKMVVIGMDKYKCQTNELIHQGFKRKFVLIDDLSTELLQSEKDAYGRIIRMMAHEVNNSIGAINSILDSVIEFGFTDTGDPELKESLIIAKKRNEGLSSFMGNYASILRLPAPNKKPLNLVLLLSKCGQLYTPIATKKDIEIQFDLPDKPILFHGDSVLLEQAIGNILKNAIEAIESNGRIKISCSENPLQCLVSDNGSGIKASVEQHLFTPFFSTKTTGQGVGLMLVREILQAHDTTFSLKTNHDTGWTTFTINPNASFP